jgi:tRNA A37 threonylcarbamoyladenosine biosynthesis protein TsaE
LEERENIESELTNLGVTDVMGKKDNVVVIEWAEKVTGVYPDSTSWFRFEHNGENKRTITTDNISKE